MIILSLERDELFDRHTFEKAWQAFALDQRAKSEAARERPRAGEPADPLPVSIAR